MINSETIQTLLQQAFPGDEVRVEGEGNKFQVTVVSEQFAGLLPVRKQQKVYAALNEHIASGAIHAVTMRLYTPEEWRKASLFAM